MTDYRAWKHIDEVLTWARYMPKATAQREDVLPMIGKDRWAGSCGVHAYSEALTARLRMMCMDLSYGVDLTAFIVSAVGHGVLTKDGSEVYKIGRLAKFVGVPLEGTMPVSELHGFPNPYVLGTEVTCHKAVPLPNDRNATVKDYEKAMAYREEICAALDGGPIIVCLHLQGHWSNDRSFDVPYQCRPGKPYLKRISEKGEKTLKGHCVSVYGYLCPTNDVRSLVLLYQDNTGKAEKDNLTIDPDAIGFYFVPVLRKAQFSSEPQKGQEHMILPTPPPPPPELPPVLDMVKSTLRRRFHRD